MSFALAIRCLIEDKGIEILPTKTAYNYLMDLEPLETIKYRFLYKINDLYSLINDLLISTGSENEILHLSYVFSSNSGFQRELINQFLLQTAEGIRMAFWGRYPDTSNEQTLLSLFFLHKRIWFNMVEQFSSGTFFSRKNGKVSWILANGKNVMPTYYLGASTFSEGEACVCRSGQSRSFINIMGNTEVDLTIVDNGKSGFITPFKHGIAFAISNINDINYIINKKGNIQCLDGYKKSDIESGAPTITTIERNKFIGFVNEKCEILVYPQFKSIEKFKGNYAIGSLPNGRYAVITQHGEIFYINKSFDYLDNSNIKNLLIGYNNHFTGKDITILDEIGREIILPIKIKVVVEPKYYPLLVQDQLSNFYYFIGANGILFNINGFEYAFPYVYEYTWAKSGYIWLLIDKNGNVLNKTSKYDIISGYSSNGCLVRRRDNGNICWINNKLKIIRELKNSSMSSPKVYNPRPFYNNLKEYFGFTVDKTSFRFVDGQLYEIPFAKIENLLSAIDFPKQINNGVPFVKTETINNECMILNYIKDKMPTKIRIEDGETIKMAFIKGNKAFVLVKSNDYSYLINAENGYRSVKFKHLRPYNFKDKQFIIRMTDGLFYLLNQNLTIISKGFAEIIPTINDIYIVKEKVKLSNISTVDKYGLMNSLGKIILPLEYDYLSYTRRCDAM